MAGKSTALSDKVLNMFAAGTFPTATDVPGTCYVALLHTAQTADDGTTAADTTYTNYIRQSIVSTSVGWNAPAAGTGTTRIITNKLLLTFPTAGATGDTVVGFAMTKSQLTVITNPGEGLYWGTITGAPKTINASDPVSIAIGALTLSED